MALLSVDKVGDDALAVEIYEPSKADESNQISQPSTDNLSNSLPGGDLLFVTWIAFGEYGDGGLKAHNFHRVDMR